MVIGDAGTAFSIAVQDQKLIVLVRPVSYRGVRLVRFKYSRWAYIVRVCDTAPYPHYIDLAHYMISGLYSAGTRTIRD